MASVVERPGRPPNWLLGSSWCFSTRKERSAAMRVDKSLPVVLRSPMGNLGILSVVCLLWEQSDLSA